MHTAHQAGRALRGGTADRFRRWAVTTVLALGWVGSAHAGTPFHFSTGDPDGLIATASRPGPSSGGDQETESADDFTLALPTRLTHATFTGLLSFEDNAVGGVSQVIIEIYQIFPLDSDVGRTSGPPTFSTSQVPTRVNSPADVEVDDRDSAAATLSFTTTILNPDFTALNHIDSGIHPTPNQTTGGEGPFRGEEVLFDVTFLTPLDLPAGHYFFVPQVLMNDAGEHFLWLSAPRPIVPPGTPFAPDLQSWIRNAELAPDWLRVGTDIVGSGAFNAAFSLDGEPIPPAALAPALSGAGLALLALLLLGTGGIVLHRSAGARGT